MQAITSRADADYKIQLILTRLTLLLFELKIGRKVSNHGDERDVPKGPLPKKLSPASLENLGDKGREKSNNVKRCRYVRIHI